MFNKKIFLVFICTILFFGNQSYCFGKKAQEVSAVGIVKEIGSIPVNIFAAYCADKILNKSKYYHDNLDGKVRTFATAIGGLNLMGFLLGIVGSSLDVKKLELTQGETLGKLLFDISVIITANYYIDKILNGNDYYHEKVDPYVKKICLAHGGGKTFNLFFDITKRLICFLAS